MTTTKAKAIRAKYGSDKRDIRCECGGPVACSGTIHPLADLGFGFKGGKFVIERKYSKKTIGYGGFCMTCGAEGHFIMPEFHDHIID